jgi:hypothetical protein
VICDLCQGKRTVPRAVGCDSRLEVEDKWWQVAGARRWTVPAKKIGCWFGGKTPRCGVDRLINLIEVYIYGYPHIGCQPNIYTRSCSCSKIRTHVIFQEISNLIEHIQKVLIFIVPNKHHYINYVIYVHNKFIWVHKYYYYFFINLVKFKIRLLL